MKPSYARALRCAATVLLALALATPFASAALLVSLFLVTDYLSRQALEAMQPQQILAAWWTITLSYGGNPAIRPFCLWTGIVPLLLVGTVVAAVSLRRGRSRELRPERRRTVPVAPQRAASTAYGNARWMSEQEMLRYAREPHPNHGGVVFGAAARLDLHPDADVGQAPLLRDHCEEDATHGQVFFPSAGGKTTAITAMNMHPEHGWRGNIVLNDPSSQAAPLFAHWREELGQRVVCIGPHRDPGDPRIPRVGINLFHGIDPTKRKFERQVRWAIEALGREHDEKALSGENAMFKVQARALQQCILADMLTNPETPPAERTPSGLFARLSVDDMDLRGKLEDVANDSRSVMARHIARTLKKVHPKTFGSFRSEVNTDLDWLLDPENAAIVSDTSPEALKPGDFANTDITIFVQLGVEMENTPQLGQAIINAILSPIYQKDRRTALRYLLLLDERKLFGNPKSLALVGSQGRKYGLTAVSMWHSITQMDTVLGKFAKDWRNNSSWEAYAGLSGEDAKAISERLDTYTALVVSEGRSTSRGGGRGANRSSGINTGTTLQPIKLASPGQIEFGFSRDEQIVLRRGAKAPMRCAKAYYWKRPDMAATVGVDPYREAA